VYAAVLAKEGDTPSTESLTGVVKQIFEVCSKPEIAASAMLEWCPPDVKSAAGGAWGAPRQDFGLMKRVKTSFGPHGVLSPGRFAGGI